MKRWKILLLIFLLSVNCTHKKFKFELSSLHAPNTTFVERERYKKDLIEKTILKNLSGELNAETESSWRTALWGMELLLYRSDSTLNAMKRAFSNLHQRSESLQRALLEAVYCLYPTAFIEEISDFSQTTTSPKLFAMAVHYLKRAQPVPHEHFLILLKERFPAWQDNPILYLLGEDLKMERPERFQAVPPLFDLLNHHFEHGKTIIYSFQRHDRSYPGLTIIKRPDGRFVKNRDGTIFHISHLARSSSNLPGYITNGNTPQGIFSIQGIDVSESILIGKTPNLQLVLPVEASVRDFFHSKIITDTVWTIQHYEKLLPETWRAYLPIHEAYYAGAAGRTEIIAHGTTIDPEFYRGESYFPNTPSLGCLTAKEIWSVKNGKCLVSDQLAFINAYRSAGGKIGYLIVVEIDDKKQPVVLDELIMDILRAEEVVYGGNGKNEPY